MRGMPSKQIEKILDKENRKIRMILDMIRSLPKQKQEGVTLFKIQSSAR